MTKILLATAALAAALLAPTSALAAESASVLSGTLTYAGSAGQIDWITVGDGSGSYAGKHVVSDSFSPTAVAGTGCVPVPSQPSFACEGVTGFDVTTLDYGDAITVMSALPAKIDAGSGDDFVTGGSGPDTVEGGAGNDDIATGGGDDRISARDGSKDVIDCGAGDDRAVTDDFDVVTNCEADPVVVDPQTPVVNEQPTGDVKDKPVVVDVPRAADPEVPELPVLPAVSPVSLLAGPVKVGRDGTAPIELTCAATEVAGCSGDVFLDPAPRGKAKGHGKGKGKAKGKDKSKDKAKVRALAARRGRFGRSPFQIAAGKKQNLSVKLSPEARNRLGLPKAKKARAARRGRRVKAKVTVVQKGKKPVAVVIELRG